MAGGLGARQLDIGQGLTTVDGAGGLVADGFHGITPLFDCMGAKLILHSLYRNTHKDST